MRWSKVSPDLDEEDEEAAILEADPVPSRSPAAVLDSLLEAKLVDELLEAAAPTTEPSGET